MNHVVSPYLHAIEGRLRIKVPLIKNSSVNAATMKGCLEQLRGVRFVKANPTTGNVLVLFDPQVLTQQELIDRLTELGGFKRNLIPRSVPSRSLRRHIGEALLQSAVQIALERLILAFI